MKILVVGDCHGKVPDMDIEVSEADIIIATGDICGDSDEMREAMFESIDSEKEWYDILGRDKALKRVEESLEKGDEILSYLNDFDKPVFLVPGNWDWIGDENWEPLAENKFQKLIDKYQNIQNINREKIRLQHHEFIGYGPCSGPEVPQYEDEKPDEEEMEELRQEYREKRRELQKLFDKANGPVIFISHNVPNQTSLDEIDNPNSPADGRHYGSLIVKDLLEQKSPALSIAGHIHEGYGKENIEDTLAINAGLESHVTIEIEEDKVQNIEFYPSLEE